MDCFIAADCEAFCERKTLKPVELNFYVQMKVTVIVILKILLIFSATDKR